MNGELTIKDIIPVTFPIPKNSIPNSVYTRIMDETTYNMYITNIYRFNSRQYNYHLNKIIRCTESELPTFKKLGYTYYPDGSMGGGIDEDWDVNLYRVGYYITTIPDCFGNTKRWMPVLNRTDRNNRIELHWELQQKYDGIIKKIKDNKMWEFIFIIMNTQILTTIGFCGNIIQTNKNIPIEIAYIILEFWRE